MREIELWLIFFYPYHYKLSFNIYAMRFITLKYLNASFQIYRFYIFFVNQFQHELSKHKIHAKWYTFFPVACYLHFTTSLLCWFSHYFIAIKLYFFSDTLNISKRLCDQHLKNILWVIFRYIFEFLRSADVFVFLWKSGSDPNISSLFLLLFLQTCFVRKQIHFNRNSYVIFGCCAIQLILYFCISISFA